MVAHAMQVALRDEVMGMRVAPSRVQQCEMVCIAAQPTGPPQRQPEQRLTALTATTTTTATITAATLTNTVSGFARNIDCAYRGSLPDWRAAPPMCRLASSRL